MKISIVIPVYNAEPYIEKCIQSSLDQTYSNIEVIAVDDGSTDNSLEILQGFSDKISIIQKSNGGTSSALNIGIKKMTGDWFKWLSADDLLKSNAIQVLIDSTSKLEDKAKSCIFYGNYDVIDENDKIVTENIEPNYNTLSNFERNVILLDHFFGNGITSLIHSSIFEKYGTFDESIGYKEDYEFWLRCCLLHDCRLYLVPENIAQYRIHSSQLTQKRYDDALAKISTIKSLVLNKLPKDKKSEYLTALKKYEKSKPLSTRLRHSIRDSMFRILPKSTSDKILQSYLNNKK